MDVSGYWNSILTYGKGYRELSGRTISCDMQLQQVGISFMGSSQDVEGEGCHPEEAVITGKITEHDHIFFVKKYPCLHSVDKKGELVLFPKIPGPDITFEGSYNDDEDRFEGNWEASAKIYLFGIIPRTVVSKGTYIMKKVL